jgi:hypothetical protein
MQPTTAPIQNEKTLLHFKLSKGSRFAVRRSANVSISRRPLLNAPFQSMSGNMQPLALQTLLFGVAFSPIEPIIQLNIEIE